MCYPQLPAVRVRRSKKLGSLMQRVDIKEQVILKRDEYIDGYHVLVFNDFDSLCVLFDQMIQSRPSNAMPCYASPVLQTNQYRI